MTDACQHCGVELLTAARGRPKRFCSDACRQAACRKRAEISCHEIQPDLDPPNFVPAAHAFPAVATNDPARRFQLGPTPGALQGDDYQLDYYDDGYPKLPACLDRRRQKQDEELAA
jgi:hypothetical protein